MTYDGSSNMLSQTSALQTTQTWTYDSFNDVTSHTDFDGNTTTYTYDVRGNLVSEVLPGAATTSYTRRPGDRGSGFEDRCRWQHHYLHVQRTGEPCLDDFTARRRDHLRL